MIEAELHRRYAGIEESEDILTSTVFGLLKYKSMRHILWQFIGKAEFYFDSRRKFSTEIKKHRLNGKKSDLKFHFWGVFANYGEPDLIIEGKNFVILLEIKYLASLSGEDQLRKYNLLLEDVFKKKRYKYLIFLTYDIVCPVLPERAIDELEEKNFYWLSWYSLPEALKNKYKSVLNNKEEITNDILKYLCTRNIILFDGFSTYPPIKRPVFWNEAFFSGINPVILKRRKLFWKEELS